MVAAVAAAEAQTLPYNLLTHQLAVSQIMDWSTRGPDNSWT